MAKRQIISSDSHVVEPPDLWRDRMDPKHGDRIPHLVKGDPYDQWYCDHQGIEVLEDILKGVPENEREMIVATNCAQLYRLG